jgi:hypothetical protein
MIGCVKILQMDLVLTWGQIFLQNFAGRRSEVKPREERAEKKALSEKEGAENAKLKKEAKEKRVET